MNHFRQDPFSVRTSRTGVKVSNVMDVETENMGEIRGTEPFMVLGNGVTLDAEGESARRRRASSARA